MLGRLSRSGVKVACSRNFVNVKFVRFASELNHQRPFADSAIFMTAVLEYVIAEVLDISAELAAGGRITPPTLHKAIHGDAELHKLLSQFAVV